MRPRVALLLAIAASLLAAGWWFVLPASLGGRATYVVTHGVSMQPDFHTGDLAIVYPASTYRSGQVAAYRSSLLHTVVLHRIVQVTANGYRFKGDNNSWFDPEQPSPAQLVGRLGLRVPHGGAILGWAHNRVVVGLLALAITAAGAAGTTGLQRQRRRRARAEGAPMTLHHLPPASRQRVAYAATAATIILLFTALAGATYIVPGQSTHREQLSWRTQLTYSYAATTPANVVYPDGRVHTGQTVFRKLVDQLTVRTTWSLQTREQHHVAGTAQLQAIVHGPAGWTHSVNLGSPRTITDDQVVLTGILDLPALDAVVSRATHLTGIPTDRYTISVQPRVTLSGSLAGAPIGQTPMPSEPAFTLAVTPDTVTPDTVTPTGTEPSPGQPAADATPSTSPTGSGAMPAKVLTPAATTQSTSVIRPGSPTWGLLGRRVPVAPIRWVAMSGAGIGLLALVLALMTRPGQSHECKREARRHHRSIITVNGLHVGSAGDVVEVASMKALTQVAQRYDRLILQPATTPGTYLVEDETGLYRYQCTHRDHRDLRATSRRHLADQPPTRRLVSEPA